MSVLEIIFLALLFIALVLIILNALRMSKEPTPEPEAETKSLQEVYAEDMAYWDSKFIELFNEALPGLCDCKRLSVYQCPTHARTPEKSHSLDNVMRHSRNNDRMVSKRR